LPDLASHDRESDAVGGGHARGVDGGEHRLVMPALERFRADPAAERDAVASSVCCAGECADGCGTHRPWLRRPAVMETIAILTVAAVSSVKEKAVPRGWRLAVAALNGVGTYVINAKETFLK
jgi:hypothetical protein